MGNNVGILFTLWSASHCQCLKHTVVMVSQRSSWQVLVFLYRYFKYIKHNNISYNTCCLWKTEFWTHGELTVRVSCTCRFVSLRDEVVWLALTLRLHLPLSVYLPHSQPLTLVLSYHITVPCFLIWLSAKVWGNFSFHSACQVKRADIYQPHHWIGV